MGREETSIEKRRENERGKLRGRELRGKEGERVVKIF